MTEKEQLYFDIWKENQDVVEVFMSGESGTIYRGTVMHYDDEIILLQIKHARAGVGYCYRDMVLYRRWISGIRSKEFYVLENENGE